MFSENNFDESKIEELERDILTETLSENLLKKRSYDIKIKFNHLSSGREIEIESNIEQMGKLIDG